MSNKKDTIDYTSRDFESIQRDLVEHVKRYYPETYQDFNESSFGMMMIDTVSYVGDVLSFYLDYQANESFLDTATEYENLTRLAKQFGYTPNPNPSSSGVLTFYILVPAGPKGLGPNSDLIPVLEQGSTFSSIDGNNFVLQEDVDFGGTNTEVRAGEMDTTSGIPQSYVIKAKGQAVSGEFVSENKEIGEFEKFKRISLNQENVSEIVSVVDSEGREYFEVQNLAQEVVYRAAPNSSDGTQATSVLKPHTTPRRFVHEKIGNQSYLQFGAGSEKEEERVPDPQKVTLNQHGKDYISDTSFDPTRLLKSKTMGVSPSNTTLSITYRVNTVSNANAAVGTITNVNNASFRFKNPENLPNNQMNSVINSIEVENEEPLVGDISSLSNEELRQRSKSYFSSQDRIVTTEDYKTFVYSMPSEYGTIKRLNAVPGNDATERKINLYMISEDQDGKLIEPNSKLKQNVRNWLAMKKPINDSIELIEASVVNLSIELAIVPEIDANKFDALRRAINRVANRFDNHLDVGEDFPITDVYDEASEARGVADVADVRVTRKSGGDYFETGYNILKNITPDGRFIHAPKNLIFEIRNPDNDIIGEVV